MQKIKLHKQTWDYEPAITLGPPGGFGTVFLGYSESGEEVAVKKLHISSSATGNRELVISKELSEKTLQYVIPFYDYGIDADTIGYYVVMAKAEKSLQGLLNSGHLPEKDAIPILANIVMGLYEVGTIVHRDLKPGNVLLHEGLWKLADFGIAKFVEDSTSLNTLKGCLSPLYAAPEQWKLERATKATDIYAFGCIAFALVTGHPPFTSGDLRQRHLCEEPPRPPVSARMQQLVFLCLRKNPNARPSIESVLKQLEGIKSSDTSHGAIAVAGAAIAANEAKEEAKLSHKQKEEDERRELANDAIKSLDFILEMMFEAIEHDAPIARRISNRGIELGSGRLRIEIPFPLLPKDAFLDSKKNIICGTLIRVEQATTSPYPGRSANLWFGEFSHGEFRWWEISYFSCSQRSRSDFEPFGISRQSELKDVDYAASMVMHTVQYAATPIPIDREHTQDFINRWLTRLADASTNKLQRPR